MSLASGTRLGPYDVLAKLGEGGMGEVYRATDTHLKRPVAIKVLPASMAGDADRLTRFQREAEVLAALNHPNIAAIYGLVKAPSTSSGQAPSAGSGQAPSTGSGQGDLTALVMELVEGEDLSALVARGPIPVADALPIARQVADALEAAHEQGIIHRDLKPANIKVRADGTVKVLDFGLAKALGTGGGVTAASGRTSTEHRARSTAHETLAATMTSPAMTAMGMILGTAAYMSPEQAKGKPVDRRADIWAFGVVLYEMLTATRLFAGDSVPETLGLIFSREIDLAKLPADTPARVRALIARCLVRDPRQRLRDIGEARIALESGLEPSTAPERQAPRPMAWIPTVIAVAAVAVAVFALWARPATVQKTSARLTIPLPPGQEITSYPAITRDGRTVAYVTQEGAGDSQLYLRDLNAFDAHPVAGSSGAKQPFFSPDGRWVAFFAQGQLQKAEVAGGSPIRLAEAAYSFGGTWNEDDTIVFTASLGSGLLRIPSSGGTPESLTTPDGAAKGYAHTYPQALPGGRHVLFTTWGQTQGAAVLSLDSRQWESVLPATSFGAAIFDPAGGRSSRLLVVDDAGGIRAAPFDPARPVPTSAETSVLTDVYYQVETDTMGWLAVSDTGTAVYATGNPARMSLVWVDHEGRVEPLGKDQDMYREVSLAPDGTRAVVRHRLGLWIHDLRRGTFSPLTSGNASSNLPLWSHDGRTIIFASNRGGDWDIYAQPADGSRPAEPLVKRPSDQFPYSILPDGTLLFAEIHPRNGRDLWTLSPDGNVTPVRTTPFNEWNAQFSPGPTGGPRWIAYASDESGRGEIYVQSYPEGDRRMPVSTGGGIQPMWSPDGQELSYVTGDAVVAVAMRPDGTFGAPRRLFDRSRFLFNDRFHTYGVSPDGTRFLMIQRDPGSAPHQLNVILNWTDAPDPPTADRRRDQRRP